MTLERDSLDVLKSGRGPMSARTVARQLGADRVRVGSVLDKLVRSGRCRRRPRIVPDRHRQVVWLYRYLEEETCLPTA